MAERSRRQATRKDAPLSVDTELAGARHPTVPRRVLVIEDNPDGRETLKMLLEMWGYAVVVAQDGADGVHKALEWRPDVALVDIGLPRLDGYQVAQQLRHALGGRTRLIALTAYSRAEDRRQAIRAGFHHFMGKPADLAELARLLALPGDSAAG